MTQPLDFQGQEKYKCIQVKCSTQMFLAALCAIAKQWNQPKRLSMNKWVNVRWYINALEYYSAIEKKGEVTGNNVEEP